MTGGSGAGKLVALTGEHEELCVNAAAFEPHEPPLPLLDRAPPVLLGVDHQGRSFHLLDVRHRVLRGDEFTVFTEVTQPEEPTNIGGAFEGEGVEEAAFNDGSRPSVALSREPAGEVPAVRATEHADAVRVEVRPALEDAVEEGEDVLRVDASPLPGDGSAVLLTVRGRPARVAEHNGVPRLGVDLHLIEERRGVGGVRASVDEEQNRMRSIPVRGGHPAVDGVAVWAGDEDVLRFEDSRLGDESL